MKHSSKFLAIFLTLAMAIGLLAIPASAAFCRDCNGTGLNSLGGDCLFCNGTGDDPHTWEPCIGPGNHDHGVFSVGPVPLHHFCDVHVPKSIHYEPCQDRSGDGFCDDCGQDLTPIAVTHSNGGSTTSIANGGTHTFPGALTGYAPIGAAGFTISNIGTDAMTDLDVNISDGSASDFDLVKSGLNRTLASGGTTSFTIKPNDGLAAGLYTEIVTISDTNIADYAFTVSFMVTATEAPNITGPQSLFLKQGYAAASSDAFNVTGTPAPTVTVIVKPGDTDNGGKITWNDITSKLNIAPGLTQGDYQVFLTVSNGVGSPSEHSFTVTVDPPDGDGDDGDNGDPAPVPVPDPVPDPDPILDFFNGISFLPAWLAKTFTWITRYILFGWLWGRWL